MTFEDYYNKLRTNPEFLTLIAPSPDFKEPAFFVNYNSRWYFKPDKLEAPTTWGFYYKKNRKEQCLVSGIADTPQEFIQAIQIYGEELYKQIETYLNTLTKEKIRLEETQTKYLQLRETLLQNTRKG